MTRRFGPMLTVTLLLMPTLAFAIPAPMSPAELMAKSDIVVDAEVTTVVCVGAPVTTAQKTATSYRATLTTVKTYKGTAPGQFHIEFTVEKWTGMQPIGGWKEPKHLVGEAGKYHLQLKKPPDVYGLTWWNAQSKTSNGQAGSLPDCTGGSSGADAGSSAQDAGSAGADAGSTPPVDAGSASGSDTGSPVDTASTDSATPTPDTTGPGKDSKAASGDGGASDVAQPSKDAATAVSDVGGSGTDAASTVNDSSAADTVASKPAPTAKKSSGCQATGQPWSSPLAAMAMLVMALLMVVRRRLA